MEKGKRVWVVVELTDDGEFCGCLDVCHSEDDAQLEAHNLNDDSYPGATRCCVSGAWLKGEQEKK